MIVLSPGEAARLQKDAYDRSRLQRLQQVREQEKRIAKAQRLEVRKRVRMCRERAVEKARAEWEREHAKKVMEASSELYNATVSVGKAHREAVDARADAIVRRREDELLRSYREARRSRFARKAGDVLREIQQARDHGRREAELRNERRVRCSKRSRDATQQWASERDAALEKARERAFLQQLAEARERASRTMVVDASRRVPVQRAGAPGGGVERKDAVLVRHRAEPAATDGVRGGHRASAL